MAEWVGRDVVLTHDIYDAVALVRAVEDYAGHLTVVVTRQNADDSAVRFDCVEGKALSEQVVQEFLNYVLDLSVRARLSADLDK
jgi:hypothetical protein